LVPNSRPNIFKFIKSNYFKVIYPSQELFDLVDNDFKSTEQLQFEQELEQAKLHHKQAMKSAKKQVCIAWLAFGAAFVTLIVTLCFNIWGTVKVESKPIENQLKQIIIQHKLPNIIKTGIVNDTLKVKVIKTLKK